MASSRTVKMDPRSQHHFFAEALFLITGLRNNSGFLSESIPAENTRRRLPKHENWWQTTSLSAPEACIRVVGGWIVTMARPFQSRAICKRHQIQSAARFFPELAA